MPTPPEPELSVVIACYNATDTLGLQLQALAEQIDPPAFEVIVVDNGSSVSPEPVVRRWQRELPLLRLVHATGEQGTSYARNVGIAQARSERIVFCDADDCAGPHFLHAADLALRIGDLVTGNVVTVQGADFAATPSPLWSALPAIEADTPAQLGLVDPAYPILMGGASAGDRQVLRALGGFDQAFFPGAEDNDLALRAVRAGYRIATAPAMTLAERGRDSAAGAYRRSYDAGAMHLKLCAAHDLWASSPHLHDPSWWRDLIKLPLVVAKAGVGLRRRGLRRELAGRIGLRVGQATGFLRYRVLGRPVQRRLGVGLGADQAGRSISQ